MSEIMIQSPRLNTDSAREHFVYATELHQLLTDEMKKIGINPSKYPKALDLAAGNGGVAENIYIPVGWKPHNITNIDIAVPDPNHVPGTNWLYIDLDELGTTLEYGENLPPEIENQRGIYDIVSIASGGLNYRLDYLADFFLRKNGIIWPGTGSDRLLSSRKSKFNELRGSAFFLEKQ